MGDSLSLVKQTHKAILFEKFNNWQFDTLDLLTVLNGTYNDIDEKMKKLEDLEVHSFEQFVEKFVPKIYENVTMSAYNVPIFSYTLDDNKVTDKNRYIKITDHAYYKMLTQMYSGKKDSGKSNREFDDREIREILLPKHEQIEAERIRKDAWLLLSQRSEAILKGENTGIYDRRIMELRNEIQTKAEGTSIGKLGQYINDLNHDIELVSQREKELNALPPGSTTHPVTGMLGFNAEGNPVILELSSGSSDSDTQDNGLKLLEAKREEGLKLLTGAVQNDLNKKPLDDYTKNMVVINYLPADQSRRKKFELSLEGVQKKKAELTAKRDAYERVYAQGQEEFIKILASVVPKILGVKVFFDHATIEGGEKGKLPPGQGLLVSNCSINEIFQDERSEKSFTDYVENTLSQQVGDNRIWLAIVPHVQIGKEPPNDFVAFDDIDPFASAPDDPFGDMSAQSPNVNKFGSPTTLVQVKKLLNITEKGKILTVFNPAVAKDAPFTFGGITANAINNVKKLLADENIDGEHAIFAYPNFTLVRDLVISVDCQQNYGVTNGSKIHVGTVNIDAAYVAAGLIVGSQQPLYLKKYGFKVDEESVCVRINLDDDAISHKIVTKFNRELATNWGKDIKNSFSSDRFGFLFVGDSSINGNSRLNNSYVFSARTMKKLDGVYQPIYKTLLKDFILAYFNAHGRVDRKKFKDFLDKTVPEWREDSKRALKKGIINAILKNDDDVVQGVKENTLKVILPGGDGLLDVEFDND